MNVKDRMANIDANLDDVQSGLEASARAAETLFTYTTRFNGLLNTPLLRAVVRHMKNLQACTRDQRAALQELRDSIKGLQQELRQSKGVVRPPPDIGSDARQQ